MKKFAWRRSRKIFLEVFFSHSRDFFSKFPHKISVIILRDIIGLGNFLFLSANPNPELRCVIFTGVTCFTLVLHLNCTALSQSELSNFFMCVINNKILMAELLRAEGSRPEPHNLKNWQPIDLKNIGCHVTVRTPSPATP